MYHLHAFIHQMPGVTIMGSNYFVLMPAPGPEKSLRPYLILWKRKMMARASTLPSMLFEDTSFDGTSRVLAPWKTGNSSVARVLRIRCQLRRTFQPRILHTGQRPNFILRSFKVSTCVLLLRNLEGYAFIEGPGTVDLKAFSLQ